MATTDDNKALMERFIELFNSRAGDLSSVMSDDFVWRGIAGAILEGRSNYERVISGVPAGTNFTIEEMIAEGDKVLVRLAMISEGLAEALGRPETSGPVYTHDIFRIENGKIAEEWSGHP